MSTNPQSESVIVVFLESVSVEQIRKHAEDIEANGGKIKDRYYESTAGIHGFSATIPEQYLKSFAATFQGDQINYIESDQTVTIQN